MTETTVIMKNGKPYERVWEECWKCSGKGRIPYYTYYANGVCFKCEGTKGRWVERRILTDKEKIQRERASQRRAEKRVEANLQKENVNTRKSLGFMDNTSVYMVNLSNTYDLRDQLKEDGAVFKPLIGWLFTQPTEKYPTIEVTDAEVFHTNENGYLMINSDLQETIKAKLPMEEEVEEGLNEYFGQVGDKVTLDLVLERWISFDGMYGTKFLYIFEDSAGRTFKWSTGKAIPQEKGDEITLTGTIKSHEEYRGILQTVLTRCKEVK